LTATMKDVDGRYKPGQEKSAMAAKQQTCRSNT
jgi:hypothetical protein